jgi:hypothetical protein
VGTEMNIKFSLCTFIFSNGGFFEYENIDDLRASQGQATLDSCSGYFPQYSNLTYDDLHAPDEGTFTVTRIDAEGVMQYYRYENLDELYAGIEFLRHSLQDNSSDYLTIYRDTSFIPLNVE